MQITVGHYKVLNPPAEPAQPNSFYYVQPDSASPVDVYLTDISGNLRYLYAYRNTAPILLASVPVNFNAGTGKQVLYTVPSGERAIVTGWDLDKLSAVPTIAAFKGGWNVAADDVFNDAIAALDLVNATTRCASVLTAQSRLVGAAGQSLGITVTTPEGSVLTARMNIFGYLTDLTGVPIKNVF